MKKFKIAVLASLVHKTAKNTQGGTEVFNYLLSKILQERGSKITIFVSGDSDVGVEKYASVEKAVLDTNEDFSNPWVMRRATFNELVGFAKSLDYISVNRNEFDLVHQSNFHFFPVYLAFKYSLAQVVTLHLPPDFSYIDNLSILLKEDINKIPFVSISFAQRKNNPKLNYIDNIYNGIDIKGFPFNNSPQNYFHWIGRIVPEKGPHFALEIAKKAKINLKFLGKIQDKSYYQKNIEKYKNEPNIGFIDKLSLLEKNKIVGNSKAFINPIDWEEPFGLVMIEAMACGTPVVAFRRGSVPEIIQDGVTGFICPPGNIDSMVKAIKKIDEMSKEQYQKMRRACRKHVKENFTIEKMVDGYERVYQKVIEDWKEKKWKIKRY